MMMMMMMVKRQGRRREKKMKKEDNDDKKMKGLFLGTSIKTSTRQTFYSVDNSFY